MSGGRQHSPRPVSQRWLVSRPRPYGRTPFHSPGIQLTTVGLREALADQGEATDWAAAWEVLTSQRLRSAQSPWGVLWVAVRRAVLGDVVAGAFATSERTAWRLSQADPTARRPSLISLSVMIEGGREPAAEQWQQAHREAPLLDRVIEKVCSVGWDEAKARAVVEAVAASATRDGKASSDAHGWRQLAARLDVAPWQVRRVVVALPCVGGPPGGRVPRPTQSRSVVAHHRDTAHRRQHARLHRRAVGKAIGKTRALRCRECERMAPNQPRGTPGTVSVASRGVSSVRRCRSCGPGSVRVWVLAQSVDAHG